MAKTQIAKIDEPEAEVSTVGREAPTLKSDCLTWNSDGFVFREAVVRLPATAIMQDLSVPGIWRVVQGNPQKSLRKLDRLVCISYDESWLVHALVTEADSHSATLAIKPTDVVRMQAKSATFETERHIIRWETSGFAIFRRSDDVVLLPQRFATIDAAKHIMFKEFETVRKVA